MGKVLATVTVTVAAGGGGESCFPAWSGPADRVRGQAARSAAEGRTVSARSAAEGCTVSARSVAEGHMVSARSSAEGRTVSGRDACLGAARCFGTAPAAVDACAERRLA
ncbi:hypothetical protein [Streptomyces sp. NPDC058683]|uniref:hypothetical protein n=1 Tax=Streptomyces sp. NPDC058683 TaxID=3346597 RepID=UPI00364D062D